MNRKWDANDGRLYINVRGTKPFVLVRLSRQLNRGISVSGGNKEGRKLFFPKGIDPNDVFLFQLPFIWRFSSSSSSCWSCFSNSSAFFLAFFFSFFFLFFDMLVVLGDCSSLGAVLTANKKKKSSSITFLCESRNDVYAGKGSNVPQEFACSTWLKLIYPSITRGNARDFTEIHHTERAWKLDAHLVPLRRVRS